MYEIQQSPEIPISPGFTSKDNLYAKDDFSLLKKMNVKKFIKPRNFQIKPNCSVLVENKLRIRNLGERNSYTFYLSNLIDLRKVYDTNDSLEEYEVRTYHVQKNTDLIIKGLGFVNIKKECDVNVYIQNHNLIEFRKSFLGSDIYE